MPVRSWVKISKDDPPELRVVACPVDEVADTIRGWFPNDDAAAHDAVDALGRTLAVGGYTDGVCRLLDVRVEAMSDWVADRCSRDEPAR